jgi:ABC-2 type transport system ATP-binding protein
MQSDVIIETRNLTKVYRDFWGRQKVRALKALDLEIRRGEIFGLLGPNGSGKTTTIKLILGLLFPTSGQALVFGKDATDVHKNERIGYLPEESYLYKFLNAEETLDFYGRLFNMSRAVRRQRVADLIEMVGLEWAKRRQLKEYSKGMTRRIGLAQALINDPELIVLDEPTTGLDPIGTHEMKEMIVDLRKKGKTVLMCSHLLADVQDVCDRIAILYQGELKAGRCPAQSPRRYRNPQHHPKPRRAGRGQERHRASQRQGAVDRQSHDDLGRPVPEDHRRKRGPSRPPRARSGRWSLIYPTRRRF